MRQERPVASAGHGSWLAVDPATSLRSFSALKTPWWIAGGWAVDLYVGTQSRAHSDLDVGVLRRDIAVVLASLWSWEIFEAKDGALTRLESGTVPRAAVNSLWCRPAGTTTWMFELMLDESSGDHWCYRRELSIRQLLSQAIHRSPSGVPFLAPEIELLYKGRSVRPRDASDFELLAPRLGRHARAWLVDALGRTLPRHPWLSALGRRQSPGATRSGFRSY
jgi:hypothetical protein